jgi:hypothetical protein
MATVWHALPMRAMSGVALVLLVALTAPGWCCYAFLPDRRQERMLCLMEEMVKWVKTYS